MDLRLVLGREQSGDRVTEGDERRAHALDDRGIGHLREGERCELDDEFRGEAFDLLVASMLRAARSFAPCLQFLAEASAEGGPVELDLALSPRDRARPARPTGGRQYVLELRVEVKM